MGNAIHAGKSGQIISRRVRHKAAVLGSHEEAMRENEICSAAVDESGAPLRAGAHQILGVKNQRITAASISRLLLYWPVFCQPVFTPFEACRIPICQINEP